MACVHCTEQYHIATLDLFWSGRWFWWVRFQPVESIFQRNKVILIRRGLEWRVDMFNFPEQTGLTAGLPNVGNLGQCFGRRHLQLHASKYARKTYGCRPGIYFCILLPVLTLIRTWHILYKYTHKGSWDDVYLPRNTFWLLEFHRRLRIQVKNLSASPCQVYMWRSSAELASRKSYMWGRQKSFWDPGSGQIVQCLPNFKLLHEVLHSDWAYCHRPDIQRYFLSKPAARVADIEYSLLRDNFLLINLCSFPHHTLNELWWPDWTTSQHHSK